MNPFPRVEISDLHFSWNFCENIVRRILLRRRRGPWLMVTTAVGKTDVR